MEWVILHYNNNKINDDNAMEMKIMKMKVEKGTRKTGRKK